MRGASRGSEWDNMANILRDLRFAWRVLRKSPGFVAVAVITLGLGIAASTVVFSWIDTVLLRPIGGVRDAHELVALEGIAPDGGRLGQLTHPGFRAFQRGLTAASGVVASHISFFTIGSNDHPGRASAGLHEHGASAIALVLAFIVGERSPPLRAKRVARVSVFPVWDLCGNDRGVEERKPGSSRRRCKPVGCLPDSLRDHRHPPERLGMVGVRRTRVLVSPVVAIVEQGAAPSGF